MESGDLVWGGLGVGDEGSRRTGRFVRGFWAWEIEYLGTGAKSINLASGFYEDSIGSIIVGALYYWNEGATSIPF